MAANQYPSPAPPTTTTSTLRHVCIHQHSYCIDVDGTGSDRSAMTPAQIPMSPSSPSRGISCPLDLTISSQDSESFDSPTASEPGRGARFSKALKDGITSIQERRHSSTTPLSVRTLHCLILGNGNYLDQCQFFQRTLVVSHFSVCLLASSPEMPGLTMSQQCPASSHTMHHPL